jgi:3'-phosphoadenosine 5'-phosphosulfate sulfotransferase (PAPS reductase)/FAD synthetase
LVRPKRTLDGVHSYVRLTGKKRKEEKKRGKAQREEGRGRGERLLYGRVRESPRVLGRGTHIGECVMV